MTFLENEVEGRENEDGGREARIRNFELWILNGEDDLKAGASGFRGFSVSGRKEVEGRRSKVEGRKAGRQRGSRGGAETRRKTGFIQKSVESA
jgi:hypothetical protein